MFHCRNKIWCLIAAVLQADSSGVLCMRPANEKRRYNVTLSLIGCAHAQNDPWFCQQIFTVWPVCVGHTWTVFAHLIGHTAIAASISVPSRPLVNSRQYPIIVIMGHCSRLMIHAVPGPKTYKPANFQQNYGVVFYPEGLNKPNRPDWHEKPKIWGQQDL